MDITIKLEEEINYRQVEELTRDAFYNNYMEGCDEHFLLHKLRKHPDYLPNLHFIAIHNDVIVGSIVYSKSKVIKENNEIIDTVTIGPISILPQYQKLGIGRKLIYHSFDVIKSLKLSPAVIIYCDPRYYGRLGFRCGEKYDIKTSSGYYACSLLVYLLEESFHDKLAGKFIESPIFDEFNSTPNEFDEFEKTFPYKEKLHTKSQDDFSVMITMKYKKDS